MSYKRHWNYNKDGLEKIYELSNSGCHEMEIDCLKLSSGGCYEGNTGETEYAMAILSGKCDISGDGFEYKNVGERMSVFEGKATAVYLPRRKSFKVNAETDLKIVIAKCPVSEDYEPQIVRPNDIIVKNLGKPGFEREAHFVVDERIKAGRVYYGENYVNGGQWTSFPGHKHDTDNMPEEGFAEEIYYYEFDKESGYGIQQVYTDDRKIDEAYTVRNGDFVEIPKGYHPCSVAPGYKCYLLWLMSCDNRGFYFTLDPEQKWQNQ